VGDLGMTHFPFNFSDFRAGWPGTTSVQNSTNLRGLQFLEIEEQKMNHRSTAAALHHNQNLFNEQPFESIQQGDDYIFCLIKYVLSWIY
jgi:hypothetical protein